VYDANVPPFCVIVRVTLIVAACVPQLLAVPATVSISPGFTVTLLLPFTVSVKGVHCPCAATGWPKVRMDSASIAAIQNILRVIFFSSSNQSSPRIAF